MKTILISTLATAGIILSASTAFALSNSPQGRTVHGFDDPAYQYGYMPAPQSRFLSGYVYDDGGYYQGVPARTYYRGPVIRHDDYWYQQDEE